MGLRREIDRLEISEGNDATWMPLASVWLFAIRKIERDTILDMAAAMPPNSNFGERRYPASGFDDVVAFT